MSPHASGLDVRACLDEPSEIAPGGTAIIPTGWKMAVDPGWEIQVRPRSGLAARHGVTVLNSPGTIDADYRGEVRVILHNHGDAPFTVDDGMRIAQLVVQRAPIVEVEIVDALPETKRGDGGFGSTGV
jgi:dUTP pyrophosphatase